MKKYRLEIDPDAQKDLLSILAKFRRGIAKAIGNLQDEPRPSGSRKLKGTRNKYRIRKGNYRVLYTISDEDILVVVVAAKHRKEVYR